MRGVTAIFGGLALAMTALAARAASLPHYSDGMIACPDGSRTPYKWSTPGWVSQPPVRLMTSACGLAASRRSLNSPPPFQHPVGGSMMTREEFNRNASKLIGTPPPR